MSDAADHIEHHRINGRVILMAVCACLLLGIGSFTYLWNQPQSFPYSQLTSPPATESSIATDTVAFDKQNLRNRRQLAVSFTLTLAAVLLLWLLQHLVVYKRQQQNAQVAHRQLIATRERLDEQSRRDALTDTSNRKAVTAFLSEIQRTAQTTAQSDGEFVALATLDIDHFQQINDVLGYFAGDAVLREIASRIQSELRAEDRLGRLEADRFAIVLCGLVAPRTGESIVHRIQEVLSQPIIYKESTINVTTTVGVSVQDSSTMDIAELFKLSDQALLSAKRDHRGSVLLLSDQAQEALSRQRLVVNAIKSHQPGDLFDLVYQPIVRLEDNSIAGCECLLRWVGDGPADLHASEFVPILEMYDDIHAVGDWVMRSSLRQFRQWRLDYPETALSISINISARQLEDDEFAQRTITTVKELDLVSAEVCLELTETVAIKHLESGRKQLALLRSMGLGISLDDFGTGYSSLQYLKTMPVSTVKIDQTFIREMMQDERDAAIVDSAIHIAAAIGLNVVAEGVDNQQQEDRLRTAGCQLVQGFYYSPPLSADAFTELLANRHVYQTPR